MKSRKVLKVLLLCIGLIFVYSVVSLWKSYNYLSVSKYLVINEKIVKEMRIVLLSDLHNHEFSSSNSSLVSKIQLESPDLIILDGDMLNEDSDDSRIVTDLIKQLTPIAPVYYSFGNHEYSYIEAGTSNLISEIEDVGATILEHNICDIEVNGNLIRLGGLYEYGFETGMQTDEENKAAISYLKEFTDTDRYTIICPHRPESLYCWGAVDSWGIDLQLSAHLHGGQVIIPFVGGLYSSLDGWFPEYDYGEFEIGDSTMIITRGLSSNRKALPRFNNPPEIVIIDIKGN